MNVLELAHKLSEDSGNLRVTTAHCTKATKRLAEEATRLRRVSTERSSDLTSLLDSLAARARRTALLAFDAEVFLGDDEIEARVAQDLRLDEEVKLGDRILRASQTDPATVSRASSVTSSSLPSSAIALSIPVRLEIRAEFPAFEDAVVYLPLFPRCEDSLTFELSAAVLVRSARQDTPSSLFSALDFEGRRRLRNEIEDRFKKQGPRVDVRALPTRLGMPVDLDPFHAFAGSVLTVLSFSGERDHGQAPSTDIPTSIRAGLRLGHARAADLVRLYVSAMGFGASRFRFGLNRLRFAASQGESGEETCGLVFEIKWRAGVILHYQARTNFDAGRLFMHAVLDRAEVYAHVDAPFGAGEETAENIIRGEAWRRLRPRLPELQELNVKLSAGTNQKLSGGFFEGGLRIYSLIKQEGDDG